MNRLLLPLLLVGCVAPDPSGRRPVPDLQPGGPPVPALTIEAQAQESSVASRPGSAHRALEPLVGEWEIALSTIAADGTESDPYRGRATLAWTLGQRFLRWDVSVSFGKIPGATTGFLGFNLRTREYQLMMVSDLATGMGIARGSGEIRGAGIVFEIEELDAESGARMVARSRIRSVSPDHFVHEYLEPTPSGKDRVTRIWHYRRAAPTR